MRIRIGARRSELSRLQAYTVGETLKAKFPDMEIEFIFKESLGDKNLNDPLWKMPDKGVFTSDFLQDLLKEKVDMVVHSWKDLPYEEMRETEVAATLEREDVRDLLLFKKTSRAKLGEPQTLRILSSSPRRSYNLIPFLSEYLPGGNHQISFDAVRGNVQTRLMKMIEDKSADGIIVAKAAIDRLLQATAEEFHLAQQQISRVLGASDWMVLPVSKNPAAPSQGALAIEILKSRKDLKEVLAQINHKEDMDCVLQERKIAQGLGGGCHQKIGCTVLPRAFGRLQFLRGQTDGGQVLDQKENLSPLQTGGKIWVARSSKFFNKKKIAVEIPEMFDGLFVSHSESWVDGADKGRVIWTPGLTTWKALASKGVWVSGCNEGLGEDEPLRLNSLAPHLSWAKLAHKGGHVSADKVLIPTYELIPLSESPKIPEDYDGYYWRSASLFDQAIANHPNIRHKQHYCGPGHTLKELRRMSIQAQILFPFEGEPE